MPESLEELRAQRALIQKHLDWLDRQITGVENTPADAPTDVTGANRTIPLHTPKVAATESTTIPVSAEADLPIKQSWRSDLTTF